MAQSIIRRWSFLFMLTLLTVLSWVWGVSNATILLWWNLAASFLALVIESLVGMGMFHQTLRDAMILREVRSLSQRIEQLSQQTLEEVSELVEAETELREAEAEAEREVEVLQQQRGKENGLPS